MIELDATDALEVLAWVRGERPGGCVALNAPAGSVVPAPGVPQGLVSSVQIYDTPIGSIAIKTVKRTAAPRPWLEPNALMAREIAVLESLSRIRAPSTVNTIAVARDPGLVVMQAVTESRRVDQVTGVSTTDIESVAECLGELHKTWLPSSADRVPWIAEDDLWRHILDDSPSCLDEFVVRFANVFGKFDPSILRKIVRIGDIIDVAVPLRNDPLRIASLDLRSDNILWSFGSKMRFIDWQFATLAPGASDLAVTIGTSAAHVSPRLIQSAISIYSRASGTDLGDATRGFAVGLVLRTAMTIPISIYLPHRDLVSARKRDVAIHRLTTCLGIVSKEVSEVVGRAGPSLRR
jgi:hypothetical protein